MCDLFTETTMQQIKQYLFYPEGDFPSTTGWTCPVSEGYIATQLQLRTPSPTVFSALLPVGALQCLISWERERRKTTKQSLLVVLEPLHSPPPFFLLSPILTMPQGFAQKPIWLTGSLFFPPIFLPPFKRKKKLYFYCLNNECQTFSHLFQNCCTGKVLEPSQPQPLGSYPREIRNASHPSFTLLPHNPNPN